MLKKLTAAGNSTALVLDRILLRYMGLEPGAMVRIALDGKRLVVEAVDPKEYIPSPKGPAAPVVKISRPDMERADYDRASEVLSNLRRHGLTREYFKLLHHDGCSNPVVWDGFLVYRDKPTIEHLGTVLRLEECLAALDAGRSWEEAIGAALCAYPIRPADVAA